MLALPNKLKFFFKKNEFSSHAKWRRRWQRIISSEESLPSSVNTGFYNLKYILRCVPPFLYYFFEFFQHGFNWRNVPFHLWYTLLDVRG
jgi:hypothetical protein